MFGNFIIKTKSDLINAINEYGFIPFFENSIPGFSIEEHISPDCWWHSETGQWSAWEWKGPVINETGCDAVMIGRGCLGNPFLINECYELVENNKRIDRPSVKEIKETLIMHYELLKNLKCEKVAILEMRSLATYYVKGLRNGTHFKQAICNIKKEEEFYNAINSFFDNYNNETDSF